MQKLTVGSLFAGVGGIELGLERTGGFETVWQCDNDPYAIRVLEKHWPAVRRWGDVATFPPESIDQWRCDLIAGGDPCQENSNARKATVGLEQSSLGGEFIRVIDLIRPRLVLRENPEKVARTAPWPWQRFRGALESLGYVVIPFRLRACCFGFDHQRGRLFLLAEMANAMQKGSQGEKLEKVASAFSKRCKEIQEQTVGHVTRRHRRLPTPRICRGADGVSNRIHRLRCLGNAVCPQVARLIGERILAAERMKQEST